MVFAPQFNYAAIAVTVVALFFLGYLWYGPMFGRKWAAYVGMSTEPKLAPKGMAMALLNQFIGTVLMVYVFAHVLAAFGAAELVSNGGTFTAAAVNAGPTMNSMSMALQGAFWTWLGFFVPVQAARAAWEKNSWGLVAINASYNLVALLIAAAILVSWA